VLEREKQRSLTGECTPDTVNDLQHPVFRDYVTGRCHTNPMHGAFVACCVDLSLL
jgi:hypothetical protein